MIAAVQLKKHMANASFLCIIISEFSYWQKLGQIILLKIDKSTKISLQSAVLSFCLAIGWCGKNS